MAGNTVREAYAKAGGRLPGPTEVEQLDEEVRKGKSYFAAIVPAHINADQYVAIVIGLLHKNEDLAKAAMRNPPSLMAALADCARLGLVPGDGYALVPFPNKNVPGGIEVVGVTEYTGEIELMYRTGLITSVVCEVVYENDQYDREYEHEPPMFSPAGGRFSTKGRPDHASDAGPAGGDTVRGQPIGGFAYVVFKGGGISYVVEMSAAEIADHRDKAKTKKIWDGPFWSSMWRKTFIHELRKWTPRSSEYVGEMMRANAAAIEAQPAAALAAPPGNGGRTQIPAPPGPAAAAEPPARGTVVPPADRPATPPAVRRIGEMLAECGVAEDQQLRAVRALAADPGITDSDEQPITRGQAELVTGLLRDCLDQATEESPALRNVTRLVAAAESETEADVEIGQEAPGA